MSRLSGYRIEDEDLVFKFARQFPDAFDRNEFDLTKAEAILREAMFKCVEASVPESKHEDADVKTDWSRIAAGWNGCRDQTLSRAKSLLGIEE